MQQVYKKIFFSILFLISLSGYSTNYYWVGGSGNWNDASHWSFSSGGSGSAGVPNGSNDHVFFDQNSFFDLSNSVLIPGNIHIGNFSINNTPNFKLISQGNIQMTVQGNWNTPGNFRNKITGQIYFSGNNSHTIFTKEIFKSDLFFNGNGSYSLSNDLLSEKNISFTAGGFISNGNALKANNISVLSNPGVLVNLSNSIIISNQFIQPSSHLNDYLVINNGTNFLNFDENNATRGTTTCGSPAMTITTAVTTNYNGYGISCNGFSDGTICVTVTGGVGPFLVNWLATPGNDGTYGDGSECFTNIDASTYTVVITDQGQGSPPFFLQCGTSQVINEPGEITLLSMFITDPSCNGACDGQAIPNILSELPIISYVWSSGETTPTASDLCVGVNSLQIQDANNCVFDTTFFILTPTPVLPNVTTQNASCFNVCDGVGYSTPSGGNGAPYTFAWSNGDNGTGPLIDSTNGLCNGNYSVIVTDNNGCTGSQNFTITEPLQIVLTVNNHVDLICNGVCTGSISISTANGTSPYTYQWFDQTTGLPVAGQISEDASNLCAGTYFVQVTDANGCQDVSPNVTITQPNAITINPSATDILCFGGCTGTLTATSAGGTGAHDYQWYDATIGQPVNGANTNNETGICAGTYFVEVTDQNGCIVNSNVVTVNEPPELILTVVDVDVLCNTSCTGSASASAVGGVGTYTFQWFEMPNTLIGTGTTINGLCAGNYFCRVIDDNNCRDTIQFTITQPAALTIITQTSTDVLCNGACNGTTTFDVSGGTAPYTITWFDAATDIAIGQSGTVASNLCPGNYYAIAVDANNCTVQSIDLNVTEPQTLTVTISSTDVTCNGFCDGTANLTISGGTSPYTIVWEDALGNPIGQSTDPATNLCPGTYHADITDANGCTVTSNNVIITEPNALSASIVTTDVGCNGDCDGTAIVTPAGGNGPFTFTWSSSANTTDTENNLCAGNYTVTVNDLNGCPFNPLAFTINQNSAFNFTFIQSNPSCFGTCDGSATVSNITGEGGNYSLTWSSSANTTATESNLCVNINYVLTITDQNGCDTAHTFTYTEPTPLLLDPQFADPICLGSCDGSASANPTGGTPPYSYTWVDLNSATTLATTTDTILNLCEGDYQVTVTDANGCFEVTQFTLTDPPGMSATTAVTSAACGAVCDGTVTVTVIDNTCPVTIQWFNATTGIAIVGQTGLTAINLCAGNYFARITDCNGCTIDSPTATVNQVVVVDGTGIETDPTCFGVCNGSINLTPSGGSAPYTFVWFDQATNLQIGQNVEDPSGLCDGTYYVVITEAAGCSSAPVLFTLTEPTNVSITLTPIDATCNSVCNGSISSVISGGNGSFSFEWFDASSGISTGITTQNASNLCAGDYELVVTDANGCTYTSNTVTISEPTSLTGTLTTTDASCFGVCDGTASYSISGGNSPYVFTWSSSANTTDTENNLCDGSYTVSVTDNNGCSLAPVNFTIDEPTQISGIIADGSVLCNGDCNGSVSVTAAGGTSPYTYQWDAGAANQTTPVASNLCAGSYDVIITDANGCTSVSLTADVTEPTAIALQSISSTDASCGGICDGTATINVTGGTPGYTFQWNDPLNQSTQTAVSLCAGNYDVIVTDANGCSLGTQSVTVNEPNALTVSVTVTPESCFNVCDGTATAVISGGTGIITTQWDDPSIQTTATASALCGGTYTVDVTDANGCSASASGTVNAAVDITASTTATDAQCGICDGTATVTASGGTGTLDILWDNNAANQTSSTATALCAGTYQVTVTDDNGCTNTFSAAVSNPNGEIITVTATDASCEGVCDGTATVTFNCGTPACSVQWNDSGNQTSNTAIGLCAGSYGVSVTNGAGCISAAVIDVEEPLDIQPNITSTDVICSGDCNGTASTNPTGGDGNYTWLWNNSDTNPATVNLCAGTYSVTVTDGNGCIGNASVIVNDPSNPLNVTTASSDANCFGVCDGTATAFPTGGTAPYTFQWDDALSQTTQMATGLCAGTYNVTVVDANGCSFGPLTVTINEPSDINGNISSNNINCFGDCNGTATLSIAGGTSPFTFAWDDPLSQTTSTATNLCSGTYTVIATDVNGCNSLPFSVTLSEPNQLILTATATNPLCNGDCNGVADAVITGGTAPYNIIWDDPASQTTSSAFNLCAGNFTVEVTDANGCFQDATVNLTAPSVLTTNSFSVDVSCFDLCDGSATVNPSGGTTPYTFIWSDGSTTNSISSLCEGNYDVDITDANGCNISQSFIIDEPDEIIANFNFASSNCGACTGSASVIPSGGVPGYTYQWDAAAGGGTAQSIANLCAGVYSVDITDASGCTESVGVSISDNNGETVSINATDVTCFGVCDGTATAVTPCVNGPCTFEWFDGSGNSTGVTVDNISNQCADDYFVEVTNSNGCITIENTTIDEPLEIEGNGIVSDATCGDVCDGSVNLSPTGGTGVFTFSWNDPSSQTTQNATGLCGGEIIVQITSGGCTIADTFFINQPDTLNATVTIFEPICNGDCDGVAALTINDGVSPYSVVWNDAQTTTAAINLCAGNYSATITDANGCVENINATVTEPTSLTASVSSNDIDCFGNCNGDATVIPSGGTSPYTFQWNDPSLQTTANATGLCAGTYEVVVVDSALCTTAPLTVTINENPDISISATSSDVTCNSFCDGSITITASGGDGNYQYSIDNGATFQASNIFTNLCGNSFNVVVMDGNNCQETINVNVNEPAALGGTVDDFNATCGVDNGSANAIPTGGTPNYSFVWMDATLTAIGQTTQGATGLGAGIYNVEITDANGCTTTLTAFISNFNAPVATVNSITSPTCNGDCNASIDMDVTGGTPGYTYLWFAGGQTTEDLSNICAGTYTLEVIDNAGCIAFANATVTENAIIDATFVSTDASCGACDGSSVVTPTGGDGSYSVIWTNGDSGFAASNLCAGAYGAQITDGAGCVEMINTSISNPTGPTGENIISTDVSCFGLCDGTADVTPIGGTAPYTFFWMHNGATTSNVSNLCAGTYFCEITDANDCIRMAEITINSAAQIIDSTVVTPADCGVCNGGLQIFANGGNGPFSFQWNAAAGSSTNQTVLNLCEGIYSVTVSDGNGCSEDFVYSVNGKNAPQISITATDANCNGTCDGTANILVTGGTGPFTDTWFDDSGNNLGLSGLTQNTLCSGDYIIQIVDQATSCLTTATFEIDQPDSLQFSLPFLLDNTCFQSCDGVLTAIVIEGTLPYNFVWDDPNNSTTANIDSLCAGTFTVTVTDANGCNDTQSATITEPTEITMTFAVTDASCSSVADGAVDVTAAGGAGGYTYSWTGPNNFTSSNEDLTNILMGTYFLTTTDANGCSQTDSVFINALLVVIADAGNDTTICGNVTSFTANGNGGVTYEWYDTTGVLLASTQSFTFNPVSGSTTSLILVAYDGLCTDSDTINITINSIPTADAGPDVFTISGTPVSIGGSPTGSSGTTFDWSPGVYADDSTLANPTVTIDTTTTFIVTVTDLNGCFALDTVLVEVLPPIFIPNGFSPNGDGPNDVWEIDFIEFFPDCQVEVYNRWGQLLFISVGYAIPWDGKYEDKDVPIGTYYYVINLNHPLFPDAYTGPLTILR